MPTDVLTPTPLTKHCPICDQDRPLTEFYARRASRDGRQRHCKECSRQTIDASQARRSEPRPLATNYAGLAAVFAARPRVVVEALADIAGEARLHPLQALADTLEQPPCDDAAPCVLHWLAGLYAENVIARYPAVVAAIEAAWAEDDGDAAATDADDTAASAGATE